MQGFGKEVQSSPPCCPGVLCRTRWRLRTCPKGKLFFTIISSSISIGTCDSASLTYMKHKQQSKCRFYLLRAPENTCSSAAVVVGERTTVFLSHRHTETSSHTPVIRLHGPMGLQTSLSWKRVAWRQPATIRGQQGLLELSACISNRWLNTKQKHKMATNCIHSDLYRVIAEWE